MKNVINTSNNEFYVEAIDKLLPFQGKEVWLWLITYKKSGHNRWNLTMEIEIEGKKKMLSTTTSDSLMIDYWRGNQNGRSTLLGKNYIGSLAAIELLFKDNEEYLLQFVDKKEDNG